MIDINKTIKRSRFKNLASSFIGIDFSTTATKVVRLKKNKSDMVLMGIDLLPAVDFSQSAKRIELPRNMSAHYGCLTYTGTSSVVRMINTPLPEGQAELPEAKLRELLNVEEDYRVSSAIAHRGQGRQDTSFLAAAIPEDDVQFLLSMFPAGPPAPASVEVAGLSFVPAFLKARGEECGDEAICLIEAGESISHFVFMNKGTVVLVGKYGFGGSSLRAKVVEDLGVDDELAVTILADQSINISTTIDDVTTPFFKQLSISKDFIERHQGCRISKVYISGGLSLLPYWSTIIKQKLKVDVFPWSPFENLQLDHPNVVPEHLATQATCFAAAMGAAIGGFEEL